MGDISDFEFFADLWQSDFHVILPNFMAGDVAAKAGYSAVDESGAKRLIYEEAPHMLARYIQAAFPGQSVFFAGISLGGKIVIELAGNYPEIFAGAVLTDVGFGPLCRSPLFEFVNEVIPSIEMGRQWTVVRQELTQKIPDKMLRLLVQSHIQIPRGNQPVQWRSSSFDFPELVSGTSLEEQWHLSEKIDRPIHILKATVASGIPADDFERLKQIPNVHLHILEGANHFVQVYEREAFARAPVEYLKNA
jgi:pimeloyl-ACP methyl ester carboxylesterase